MHQLVPAMPTVRVPRASFPRPRFRVRTGSASCDIFGPGRCRQQAARRMPTTRQDAEFEALRATIRERGTVRLVLLPVCLALWAAAAIATTAAVALPIAALVPLLVLAAGFEAIYALHVNVERIGRYLQVFHEDEGGWEHVAVAFGQRFPGGGPDPLFSGLFLIAAALNYLPVALGGTMPELIVAGLLHLLLALHIGTARQRAARQRSLDHERFTAIKNG
jgi:hypothetical protein